MTTKVFELTPGGGMQRSIQADLSIGQIIWLNGYGQNEHSHERKAIYAKSTSEFQRTTLYKWVNLDKPQRGISEAFTIRHVDKLFGIGTYYLDNDMATSDQISRALELAEAEEKRQNEIKVATKSSNDLIKEEGRRIIEANMPDYKPEGFIIAELEKDESDLMTDYHGSSTQQTIILAWTPKKRENFAEMRKACLNSNIEAIRSLATAPKEYEHRQNYSMGGGYFLGESRYSGWKIRKSTYHDISSFYLDAGKPNGFFAFTKQNTNNRVVVDVKEGTYSPNLQLIIYSEKSFAITGDTKPVKETLKQLGGKFNPRLKGANNDTFVGWIFSNSKRDIVEKTFFQKTTRPHDHIVDNEHDNGPTGHGDICYSDADSGL